MDSLKNYFITRDCYKYVNRVLIVPKTIGLFPFDNEFNFSWFYLCHSCAFFACVTTGSLYICNMFYKALIHSWDLSHLLNMFEILITFIHVLVGFALLISEKQRLLWVLENLFVIEWNLSAVGQLAQYNVFTGLLSTYLRLLYLIITLFLLVYSRKFITISGVPLLLSTFFMEFFPITSHLLMRPYIAIMSVINEQYSSLNILLHRLSTTLDHRSRRKIEKLISINTELYDVCDNLNGLYSWIIFMWIVSAWIIIVVNAYFIFCTLVGAGNSNEDFTYELFSSFNTTLVWCIELYSITQASNKVTNKSLFFHNGLYNMTLRDKDDYLGQSEKLQTHFAFEPTSRFVACGYLTLDNSMIHGMLAAATTYIVLLIQYGTQPSGKN